MKLVGTMRECWIMITVLKFSDNYFHHFNEPWTGVTTLWVYFNWAIQIFTRGVIFSRGSHSILRRQWLGVILSAASPNDIHNSETLCDCLWSRSVSCKNPQPQSKFHMCQQVIFQAQVGTQNREGVFVFAKKMDYQGMHEQECDVERQVTGLKGIGGQAVYCPS